MVYGCCVYTYVFIIAAYIFCFYIDVYTLLFIIAGYSFRLFYCGVDLSCVSLRNILICVIIYDIYIVVLVLRCIYVLFIMVVYTRCVYY